MLEFQKQLTGEQYGMKSIVFRLNKDNYYEMEDGAIRGKLV